MSKMHLIEQNKDEIRNIEKIFEELLMFIDNNVDSKILQKANDVTTFLHKSFTDLDIITKNQIAQKSEIYIHPSFKPLTLNVKKAIEIVGKFEMVPPNSSFQQKPLNMNQYVKNMHSQDAAGDQSQGSEAPEIDPYTGRPYGEQMMDTAGSATRSSKNLPPVSASSKRQAASVGTKASQIPKIGGSKRQDQPMVST